MLTVAVIQVEEKLSGGAAVGTSCGRCINLSIPSITHDFNDSLTIVHVFDLGVSPPSYLIPFTIYLASLKSHWQLLMRFRTVLWSLLVPECLINRVLAYNAPPR